MRECPIQKPLKTTRNVPSVLETQTLVSPLAGPANIGIFVLLYASIFRKRKYQNVNSAFMEYICYSGCNMERNNCSVYLRSLVKVAKQWLGNVWGLLGNSCESQDTSEQQFINQNPRREKTNQMTVPAKACWGLQWEDTDEGSDGIMCDY